MLTKQHLLSVAQQLLEGQVSEPTIFNHDAVACNINAILPLTFALLGKLSSAVGEAGPRHAAYLE
jgi:hypothetical protein